MPWNSKQPDLKNNPLYLEPRVTSVEMSLAQSMSWETWNRINVKMPFNGLTPVKGDYVSSSQLGTDDTANLQAIIDYAEAHNLGIYIPKCDMRIDGTLELRANTNILSDRAFLHYTGTSICMESVGTAANNTNTIRLRGLKLERVNQDQKGTGLNLLFTYFSLFEDCDFWGFQYGVFHGDPNNVKYALLNHFTGCRFSQNQYGIKFEQNSNGCTLDKCFIFGNTDIGIWINRAYELRIINCEIEATGKKSGGHGIQINDGSSNLIQGCYFENNAYNDTNSAVIHIDSTNTPNLNTVIMGNNFTAGGIAHTLIKAINAKGLKVTGNNFDYDSNLTYDLDISQMPTLDDTYINGNSPSGLGRINVTKQISRGSIQHSDTAIPAVGDQTTMSNSIANYTNSVNNGSFENGSTGWTVDNGGSIVTEQAKIGANSFKAVSTNNQACYIHWPLGSTVAGHKYYVSGYAFVVSMSNGDPIIQFNGTNIYFDKNNLNRWQKTSGIISATGTSTPLYIGNTGMSGTCYYDGILVTDLTVLFGAGNEPSVGWCDINLPFK